MPGLLRPGIGLGTLTLLAHESAKALRVDGQALLGRHLQGEIDGKPERVVQLEGPRTGEYTAARLLRLARRQIEDGRPGAQRRQERRLLGGRHRVDPRPVGDKFGILRAHRLDRDRDHLGHGRVRCTEQAHVANRAAHHPAQHVAASLVAGQHAVADEHHRGAHMIGNHPQRHVGGRRGAVAGTGELRGPVEDQPGGVDLVEVVDALEHRGETLQAEAGVDVLRREIAEDRVVLLGRPLTADGLHEDQVPELQVTLAVHGGAPVDPERRPAVVVDLRTGSARPRHTHRPEVVLHTEALDALGRHPHRRPPDLSGLVVVEIDGHPQPAVVQPVPARRHRRGE